MTLSFMGWKLGDRICYVVGGEIGFYVTVHFLFFCSIDLKQEEKNI